LFYLQIIEDLYVFGNLGNGLLLHFEFLMVYQFGFDYPPEAFYRGIIIAVTLAVHGSDYAKLL